MLSGNVSSYLTYGDSVSRGVASSGVSMIVAELLLLSVISFCSLFFRQDRLGTVANLVLIVCYSIVTGWISGKRFMLAILIVLYLFFYLRRNPALEQRKKVEGLFSARALRAPFLLIFLSNCCSTVEGYGFQ